MLGGLFSLTPNMIAWHGIFQLLDGVSFSSRQPLFTNETRPMKLAMRRAHTREVVCRFAFRRKFTHVVSFRSRQTSRLSSCTGSKRVDSGESFRKIAGNFCADRFGCRGDTLARLSCSLVPYYSPITWTSGFSGSNSSCLTLRLSVEISAQVCGGSIHPRRFTHDQPAKTKPF
ncbi:hypothetical protein T03_7778 [Trichinella britovi]|uniref:Uncharacterized protein n=1 Tax=Trichinella britovi TaxID=45882 RepID=A0A0V1C322_TRIBR|nr:hypothetical protein T03_7778 [Trichinella britovi]